MTEFLDVYKDEVDTKYNVIITRFSKKLTHPSRIMETSLGNLVADAMAENADKDVVLFGSGAIRSHELGSVVTLRTLKECFPYDDNLTRFSITGKQLKKIFSHIMRIENRDGEGEFYQVNDKIKAIYSEEEARLLSLSVNEKAVQDEQNYTITLQGYHIANSQKNLNISHGELTTLGNGRVVTTSAYQVFEEWLRVHPNLTSKIEGRLVFK